MEFISASPQFWTQVLCALILGIIIYFICTRSFIYFFVAIAILTSPPFSLMYSSGNPDILSIVMFLIAASFLTQKSVFAYLMTILIIFAHKFYSIVLFFIPLELYRRLNLAKVFFGGVLIACSFGIVAFQLIFYSVSSQMIDAGNNHYGLGIWDNYGRKLGLSIPEWLTTSLGLFTLFVLARLLFYPKVKNDLRPAVNDFASNAALILYTVFAFSYVVTANVDYRLVFLGLAVILDLRHYLEKALYRRNILFLAICSFYLSYPWGYYEFFKLFPVQTLGDALLHIVVAYSMVRIWNLRRGIVSLVVKDEPNG